MEQHVVVICTAADGTPAAPVYYIQVTEEQYDLGEHYDIAIDKAIEDGYEGSFKCFDNSEHYELIRTVEFLTSLTEA